LVAATSEAGYGPLQGRTSNTYPGASGGPVFNASGELFGEVVATMDDKESTSDISDQQGVKLSSNHPSEKQITIIQPVTSAILQTYIKKLPQKPTCSEY
jgi:hypothetical protein